MKLSKEKIILISIVLLGFFLRIFLINANPLYGDELTMVYDSYSILKTGHDQTGLLLPLTFPMGAGRPGGYVYFSVPFVALFGPTALGVRMLSVLSGVGLILIIYFLVKTLFKGSSSIKVSETALFASFITAVNPWSINLSRAGFEANFALFLASLGVLTFFWAIKKPWLYLVSALCFGLTLNTYPTYKLTLPLFFLVLIWFRGNLKEVFKGTQRKFAFFGVIIFGLFCILILSQTFLGGSESRFFDLNIFSKNDVRQLVLQDINFNRSMARIPEVFRIIFYNKIDSYFLIYLDSYFKNLSFDFLFLHGDGQPVHNMGTIGGFYLVEIISIALGVLMLFAKDKKLLTFLLIWVLIVPLATAFLGEMHFLRNSFMLTSLIIFSGIGLASLWQIKYKWVLGIVLIIFLIQSVSIFQKMYLVAPNLYSQFWSQPAKNASLLALTNKNRYDFILLSDRIDNIEYALPVYGKIDPDVIISQNKQRSELNGLKFKQIGNIFIGNIPEKQVNKFFDGLNGRVLLLDSLVMQDKIIGATPVTNTFAQPEFLILKK
jgi:4-amino-4-deoxy-L-arabinose transferase-like glycosyltransferase